MADHRLQPGQEAQGPDCPQWPSLTPTAGGNPVKLTKKGALAILEAAMRGEIRLGAIRGNRQINPFEAIRKISMPHNWRKIGIIGMAGYSLQQEYLRPFWHGKASILYRPRCQYDVHTPERSDGTCRWRRDATGGHSASRLDRACRLHRISRLAEGGTGRAYPAVTISVNFCLTA